MRRIQMIELIIAAPFIILLAAFMIIGILYNGQAPPDIFFTLSNIAPYVAAFTFIGAFIAGAIVYAKDLGLFVGRQGRGYNYDHDTTYRQYGTRRSYGIKDAPVQRSEPSEYSGDNGSEEIRILIASDVGMVYELRIDGRLKGYIKSTVESKKVPAGSRQVSINEIGGPAIFDETVDLEEGMCIKVVRSAGKDSVKIDKNPC